MVFRRKPAQSKVPESKGEEAKICAFGPCTCPVDDTDRYCGPTCRLGIGERAEPCKCGHSDCAVSIGDG